MDDPEGQVGKSNWWGCRRPFRDAPWTGRMTLQVEDKAPAELASAYGGAEQATNRSVGEKHSLFNSRGCAPSGPVGTFGRDERLSNPRPLA